MDATFMEKTFVGKIVGKGKVELDGGNIVQVEKFPKKFHVGELVKLLLEETTYSFLGVIVQEKTVEKVQEKVSVEKPYRFINFLNCGHSWILNRDGNIYSQLEKKQMMHYNYSKDVCPDCGGKFLDGELFKKNLSEEESIFSDIERISSKKDFKRKLAEMPNKTVKFICGHYAWVNKRHGDYIKYTDGEILGEHFCPICGDKKYYGWGEVFFRVFQPDGNEIP